MNSVLNFHRSQLKISTTRLLLPLGGRHVKLLVAGGTPRFVSEHCSGYLIFSRVGTTVRLLDGDRCIHSLVRWRHLDKNAGRHGLIYSSFRLIYNTPRGLSSGSLVDDLRLIDDFGLLFLTMLVDHTTGFLQRTQNTKRCINCL